MLSLLLSKAHSMTDGFCDLHKGIIIERVLVCRSYWQNMEGFQSITTAQLSLYDYTTEAVWPAVARRPCYFADRFHSGCSVRCQFLCGWWTYSNRKWQWSHKGWYYMWVHYVLVLHMSALSVDITHECATCWYYKCATCWYYTSALHVGITHECATCWYYTRVRHMLVLHMSALHVGIIRVHHVLVLHRSALCVGIMWVRHMLVLHMSVPCVGIIHECTTCWYYTSVLRIGITWVHYMFK
jgi:hypothetical protein